MNFSLDRAVGAVDFGNVLFRLSFNDYHTALEDYTGVIDQDTLFYREVSSDADAEQAIARKLVPADALHALRRTDQFQTLQVALPAGACRLFDD